MGRARSGVLLRAGGGLLYRQIYDHIRAAIAAGQLRPGDRLPPTRALATQFGTARGTAEAAYAILAGEGYVVGRGRAGTMVSPDLDSTAFAGAAVPRAAGRAQPHPIRHTLPFQMGLPALDAFPRKLWSRLAARRARTISVGDMAYPDPAGYAPLREAIAAYLATSRGITCTPDQIIVTTGYQGALHLIADALLRPGDRVWFEDPGYFRAREALEDMSATLAPDARFVLVTPSHQATLGVALSLRRRSALLSWAENAGAWIIEDDYDSEFRYVGRPLPALKSLDRGERVLYAGSFSKVLYPGLRLGYVVVPDRVADVFARASRRRWSGCATFEQAVVADFMAGGHFARHLKRMRGLYASRRQALVEALTAVFGERIALDLQPGGMHLIARLPDGIPDAELARLALTDGLAVEALSDRTIAHRCGQALLFGFANIAERDALQMCRRLERAIGKRMEGSGNGQRPRVTPEEPAPRGRAGHQDQRGCTEVPDQDQQ
jgi:GntR family transcriptional regulator/MocR family aminotransferase